MGRLGDIADIATVGLLAVGGYLLYQAVTGFKLPELKIELPELTLPELTLPELPGLPKPPVIQEPIVSIMEILPTGPIIPEEGRLSMFNVGGIVDGSEARRKTSRVIVDDFQEPEPAPYIPEPIPWTQEPIVSIMEILPTGPIYSETPRLSMFNRGGEVL